MNTDKAETKKSRELTNDELDCVRQLVAEYQCDAWFVVNQKDESVLIYTQDDQLISEISFDEING